MLTESPVLQSGHKTIVNILKARAAGTPDSILYHYFIGGKAGEECLSYAGLERWAKTIAGALQQRLRKGDRALLLYPPGLDYIKGFFGCLYAGIIAVPAYPPDPARIQRSLPRLQSIINDAQAKAVLTTSTIASAINTSPADDQELNKHFADLLRLDHLDTFETDLVDPSQADEWRDPDIHSEDLAFLQYTSGSTGDPKGVMISHGNLVNNLQLIRDVFGLTPEFRAIGWLPMYHDMGLIGFVLEPLYAGIPCDLMSPLGFLQWPMRWLNLISSRKDQPVISGAPNFAYELCLHKAAEEQNPNLDLSNWRIAFSGAEPVRSDTIRQFTEKFAPFGFRKEAFYPCYGLAESTLLVSGGLQSAEPVIMPISKKALAGNHALPPLDDSDALGFVSCGRPGNGHAIAIVKPGKDVPCAPGEIGEIWVRGPSVAQGYWKRPNLSQKTFCARIDLTNEGPFLRTGDLGFIQNGELFITGRLKDLIIIRGRNHYPQDIERTAQKSHPALRPGSAVFSIEESGEERLVVVQEARLTRSINAEEVISAIRQSISEEHELQPCAVVLIKPRSIPKTSSGKIRRRACKEDFLNGKLEILKEWRASSPEQAASAAGVESESEQLPMLEERLRSLLASTLNIRASEIDVDAPVTSFGLDSLTAASLKHEIKTEFGISIPLSTLVAGPSVRDLVQLLADPAASPQIVDSPSAPASCSGEFPLSEGQKALWFQHQLAPESIFNPAYAVRVHAPIDVDRLRAAFQKVVDRHEMLRATFHSGTAAGEPFHRIHESAEVCFECRDARGLNPSDVQRILGEAAARAYDLEKEPLFRITLITEADDKHILLLASHHIISDMWSEMIIVDEVAAQYGSSGSDPALPKIQGSYAEYVQRQNDMLAGEEGALHWNYWKEKLNGELPVLTMPIAAPRPSVQTYRAAVQSLLIQPQIVEQLKIIARREGVTLFMMLLAAYKALLHRYTGQSDLIVGTAVSGRTNPVYSRTVGYFAHPVPIRTSLDSALEFTSYLKQVRKTVAEAIAHQEYPINLLVRKLQPARDPGHTPIFQTMFAYQRTHLSGRESLSSFALGTAGERAQVAGLPLESVFIEEQVVPFDMTLMMAQGARGLGASLTYNTDLFDAESCTRLLECFHTLLESIARDPAQTIGKLELLPHAMHRQITVDWNQTLAAAPPAEFVQNSIERQAARRPDAPAIVLKDRAVSYRRLNEEANQLAHYLREQGVGPDTPIGICIERSLEMITAILGIIKAGGAYVPMDPEYPDARIRFMIEDAQMSTVITRETLAGRFTGLNTVLMDRDWPAIAQQPCVNPPVSVSPDNLAYVIYTSGSTGAPKGVMLTHRGLSNLVRVQIREFEITEQSRVLQFASISFDASVSEIFTALSSGAAVCLVDRETQLSGPSLAAMMRAQKITTVTLPPSILKILPEENLPDLKTLVSAGEACTAEIVRRWSANRRFLNAYGPTEVTVCGSCCRLKDSFQGARVPIGRPIEAAQYYILDENLSPTPQGVPGQLHIGGIGLARGYYARPDLTAEKFIPDPFSGLAGARLYCTGDLARYMADGNVEFLGRIDNQVKVRGFRIEVEEVERALAKHPEIEESAVAAVPAQEGARLAAYIVLRSGATVTAAECRGFLRESLPEYMIPSTFEVLDSLPRLPGGKVDRSALRHRKTVRLAATAASAVPQNDAEIAVAAIWKETLGIEAVGREDNFFDLGGHSLLAAQVHAKLQEKFCRTFSMVEIFRCPTIASLANFLSSKDKDDSVVEPSRTRAEMQKNAVMRQRELRRAIPAGAGLLQPKSNASRLSEGNDERRH